MYAYRSLLYWLASGLFDQPQPQKLAQLQQVINQLIAVPLNTPWQSMVQALVTQVTDSQILEIEYNRLFILAYPQPVIQPYGAYWLEAKRQLIGSSTLAVQALMAQYGIEVDPAVGLLADHIVTELEFMAYLADQEAWETQYQLLDQHLLRWLPDFLAALRAAQPLTYYQHAADFLEQLLHADAQRFNLSC